MLRFLTTAAVAALCSIATAQDGGSQPAPSLSLGDKAPKVDLSKVVKGDFDGKFKNDKVYVIEFWATWCGPCKTSMPHLSELQQMYKDKGVTIIGVSDETEKKVADFIGTEHYGFTFTVQEGIDAVSDVIYHLETYDVTTIRAGTPMFLLARKIKAMGVKMVMSGEGADETLAGKRP